MPGTRKLGRATSHRTAMLRGMVTFLFENSKIETTVTRAKEVRSLAEKMITIAKQDNLHNRRLVMAFLTKEDITNKLFTEIAPLYTERNGGYTRIAKLGPRRGDAAEMAIIELIPVETAAPVEDGKKSKKGKKAAKKSTKAAAKAQAPAKAEPAAEEVPVEEAKTEE